MVERVVVVGAGLGGLAAAAVAAAAAISAFAESAAAGQSPVGSDELEQLTSMDDWGGTQKAGSNDIEFSSSTGIDFNRPSAQPATAPAVEEMVSMPADENLLEFESAPPVAELSLPPTLSEAEFKATEPEFNAPELQPAPEAVDLGLILTDDFDLAPELPAASTSQPDEALDLDFPEALEPVATDAMPVLDLSGIDLDLEAGDLSEVEAVATPAIEEAAEIVASPVVEAATDFDPFAELSEKVDFEPSRDFQPELEPELGLAAGPAETGIDSELNEEVNTKLDLARAYLEMGDREGAHEILQEVLGEGDAQQKTEAEKLLAESA